MSVYITIDGGTTSTRVNLFCDGAVLDTIRLDVGARASIDNRENYVAAIKNAVDEISARNDARDVVRILASGMITSEFGLCNLPHIKAPAGISELHETMYETKIDEISDIPFVFVRGVKTDSEDVADFDMMRGEETELMGILDKAYGNCVYVLPGSHSKIIKVDKEGRIVSFSTMLSGEMLFSLSQYTILKDAVDIKIPTISKEYLLKGYEFAQAEGINKSLFKVRTLKNNFGCSKEEIYSFYMGVILCDEIENIIREEAETIVVGGRAQIKEAMALILREKTDKNIVSLDERIVDSSTSTGLVRIYEHNK